MINILKYYQSTGHLVQVGFCHSADCIPFMMRWGNVEIDKSIGNYHETGMYFTEWPDGSITYQATLEKLLSEIDLKESKRED